MLTLFEADELSGKKLNEKIAVCFQDNYQTGHTVRKPLPLHVSLLLTVEKSRNTTYFGQDCRSDKSKKHFSDFCEPHEGRAKWMLSL